MLRKMNPWHRATLRRLRDEWLEINLLCHGLGVMCRNHNRRVCDSQSGDVGARRVLRM